MSLAIQAEPRVAATLHPGLAILAAEIVARNSASVPTGAGTGVKKEGRTVCAGAWGGAVAAAASAKSAGFPGFRLGRCAAA